MSRNDRVAKIRNVANDKATSCKNFRWLRLTWRDSVALALGISVNALCSVHARMQVALPSQLVCAILLLLYRVLTHIGNCRSYIENLAAKSILFSNWMDMADNFVSWASFTISTTRSETTSITDNLVSCSRGDRNAQRMHFYFLSEQRDENIEKSRKTTTTATIRRIQDTHSHACVFFFLHQGFFPPFNPISRYFSTSILLYLLYFALCAQFLQVHGFASTPNYFYCRFVLFSFCPFSKLIAFQSLESGRTSSRWTGLSRTRDLAPSACTFLEWRSARELSDDARGTREWRRRRTCPISLDRQFFLSVFSNYTAPSLLADSELILYARIWSCYIEEHSSTSVSYAGFELV